MTVKTSKDSRPAPGTKRVAGTAKSGPRGATSLKAAVEAREIVIGLQRHGVPQAVIAEVTLTDTRSVYAWKQGSTPRRSKYDRLAGLRDVVLVLAESLTKTGVTQWLRARNRYLGGERPVEVLSEGRIDDVLEAANAYAEGVYL